MNKDLGYFEKTDFHEWYKEKYNKDYPYTYSEINSILAGRSNKDEHDNTSKLVKEYRNDKGMVGTLSPAATVFTEYSNTHEKEFRDKLDAMGIVFMENNLISLSYEYEGSKVELVK